MSVDMTGRPDGRLVIGEQGDMTQTPTLGMFSASATMAPNGPKKSNRTTSAWTSCSIEPFISGIQGCLQADVAGA